MKKTLFAATMVVALTLTAAAAQKPAPSQHLTATAGLSELARPGTPPALCSPCIFYGGDLNPDDGQASGFSDENTLLVTGSSTYASFTVPTGGSVKVTGILVNVQADANFDPLNATYDIREGVSEGNGGTSLASGTANITVATTGRVFLGVTEFTVLVTLPAAQSLGPGQYWFNVTPQCTNGDVDGSCSVGRVFFSNTTQETNNVYGHGQTPYSLFLNSAYFGFTWANWCDAAFGLVNGQCRFASFGLTGTAKNH